MLFCALCPASTLSVISYDFPCFGDLNCNNVELMVIWGVIFCGGGHSRSAGILSGRLVSGSPVPPTRQILSKATPTIGEVLVFSFHLYLPIFVTSPTRPIGSALIQRAAVYDGLRVSVAAKHNKQIADHRSLTLLVKLYDIVLPEFIQRHLDHADRALDDHLAGVDYGGGLLSLQHRRGDLFGI